MWRTARFSTFYDESCATCAVSSVSSFLSRPLRRKAFCTSLTQRSCSLYSLSLSSHVKRSTTCKTARESGVSVRADGSVVRARACSCARRACLPHLMELAADTAQMRELHLEVVERTNVDRRAVEHECSTRLHADRSDIFLGQVDHRQLRPVRQLASGTRSGFHSPVDTRTILRKRHRRPQVLIPPPDDYGT